MRSLAINLIVINLIFSLNAFGQVDIEEEAQAKAELEAQEAAMAKADQQAASATSVKVSTPNPAVPLFQPKTTFTPPVCNRPNNLTLFMNSLPWGKKDSSTIYLSSTRYLMNRNFIERLGVEEGQVLKCPIQNHGFHFLDNKSRGLVLTDNRTRHIDLPPLSSLAMEARDYILSLTQRENLEIHLWTRGYVITEAGTGLVLTVEIKD